MGLPELWIDNKRLESLSQSWNTFLGIWYSFSRQFRVFSIKNFTSFSHIGNSYEEKLAQYPIAPTLTPSLLAGPENMEGLSPSGTKPWKMIHAMKNEKPWKSHATKPWKMIQCWAWKHGRVESQWYQAMKNDSLPVHIPWCDKQFVLSKEEKLIDLGYFFSWRA